MNNSNQQPQNQLVTSKSHSEYLPSLQEWALLKDQAEVLLKSGLLPANLGKPEQVIMIILKGRELGISPITSLTHIHVIKGKPAMSAELMLSQIYKLHPRTVIEFVERSNTACRVKVTRLGHFPSEFVWTIEDAKKADLMGNPSWSKYPRAMLHARVVSEMARSLFPDAIQGISYTPEELGAVVDEEGSVVEILDIDAQPEKKPKREPKKVEPVKEQKGPPTVNKDDSKWVSYLEKFFADKGLNWSTKQQARAIEFLNGKIWNSESFNEVKQLMEWENQAYQEFTGPKL
jgi:hypothetical protein